MNTHKRAFFIIALIIVLVLLARFMGPLFNGMQSFQKVVLISAIVVLILVLIFIGFVLNNAKESVWPPIVGECPDYWVDMSGNGSMCTNVKNLGNGTCKPIGSDKYLTMDFTQPAFLGGNSMCAKYKWATSCGVTWDGITYGIENPCDASGNNLSESYGSCAPQGIESSKNYLTGMALTSG
jgi:hypothetical protein